MDDSGALAVELLAADGVRLAGRFWPAPDARLGYAVVHGLTGSSRRREVEAICTRLAGRGAGVVALDLRGHGASDGHSGLGAVEDLDLAAAVGFLRAAGYTRVATAGWSMGGSIVVRHAALHRAARGEEDHTDRSSVDAVVTVSGPGLWYERGTVHMRRVHFGAETRFGHWLLAAAYRTRLDSGWHEAPEAPVELAGRIPPTPLLVVHGNRDRYFPVRHAEALAAAANTAELWVEDGMGHAEGATSPELVDRVDDWVRRAVGALGPPDGAISRRATRPETGQFVGPGRGVTP
jgi:pimeloyl-ACP methyl ester carboxylesterase